MNNILIRGCPGSGKTFLSRAIAYYLCFEKLSVSEILDKNIETDLGKIKNFYNTQNICEYIQVHPSMDYNDIVFGLQVSVNDKLNIEYAEKRIMKLCSRAKKDKHREYSVILDDINRTDSGRLLGNVLYAMEYRNQEIQLADGKTMCIPENVSLIFTENTLEQSNNLDLAVRRRMTFFKELKSSKDVIKKHYRAVIKGASLDLILDIYDRVENFIKTYASSDIKNIEDYIPGHGMYMVPAVGTAYFVLDNFRQKVRFQIVPYLMELFSRGIIISNPDIFGKNLLTSVNVGIKGICPIKEIKKTLVFSGKEITSFSLVDSRDYFKNIIIKAGLLDYRGMMECIIDATILNGILPQDVLMGSLLTNTNVTYIESQNKPRTKAAFLVKKHDAIKYSYETIKNNKITGTHSYYTLEIAATGRWKLQDDTEEYIVSYNNGTLDEEYIPISGFRNHGFSPNLANLRIAHNSANVMSASYRLVEYYYNIYKYNIALVMDETSDYVNLYNLIRLEMKYVETIKNTLIGRGKNKPTGDSGRVKFLMEKFAQLRLLWHGVNERLVVDKIKYDKLVNGDQQFTLDSYEDLYTITSGDLLQIEIKGVIKMVDLNDYQKIMENIGIGQMIFQGPPGTSKTFESKKFILQQLEPNSSIFQKKVLAQEDISNALDCYKLTDEDYDDPFKSNKLATGGWDLVQFHPSYGYEDFIRGIEVKIPKGATTPSYSSVNRILGKIAEFARCSSDKIQGRNKPKFYLIIDEINRANLAAVFGELIYGLEYRESKVSTPYEVKDKLSGNITKDIVIGKNLFIIGTMNTADKSIDSIDYAIRRRFLFVDSPARRDVVLSSYQNVSGNADENLIELLLYDAVQSIFDSKRFFNNEYQKNDVRIGHTFFLRNKKKGYEDAIIEKFIFQVIPIMREYVKDGILETSENLISKEHTVFDIHLAQTDEEKISMLGENIMLYVKEFGNLNKSNSIIDNEYVGKFIDDLRKEFSY